MSGQQKLVSLFASPFLRAWQKIKQAALERTTERTPKNCQFVGYVGGITPRTQGYHARQSPTKRGIIVRGKIHITQDEEEGSKFATKTRSPYLAPSPPIPVWRMTWPDNGRKSKRHAQA